MIRPHLNLSNISLWIHSKKIIQILLMRLPMQYFCCRILILVRSIKLNLFISPVLGVDFSPFPSGYKYDICFNNIQSKLASSHSYCRSQLIQTIYLPLPPQQKTYSQSLIQYPSKYKCSVLILGVLRGVIIEPVAGNLTKNDRPSH